MGGSVGVFELIHPNRARTHTEPKSAVPRLMVSHGWSIRSPTEEEEEEEGHKPRTTSVVCRHEAMRADLAHFSHLASCQEREERRGSDTSCQEGRAGGPKYVAVPPGREVVRGGGNYALRTCSVREKPRS